MGINSRNMSLILAIGGCIAAMLGLAIAFMGYEIIGRAVAYPAILVGGFGILSGIYRFISRRDDNT
ncbi:MAG TPA: hypothetical protein VF267_11340 [Gammaproteobacteria bacterium]